MGGKHNNNNKLSLFPMNLIIDTIYLQAEGREFKNNSINRQVSASLR